MLELPLQFPWCQSFLEVIISRIDWVVSCIILLALKLWSRPNLNQNLRLNPRQQQPQLKGEDWGIKYEHQSVSSVVIVCLVAIGIVIYSCIRERCWVFGMLALQFCWEDTLLKQMLTFHTPNTCNPSIHWNNSVVSI